MDKVYTDFNKEEANERSNDIDQLIKEKEETEKKDSFDLKKFVKYFLTFSAGYLLGKRNRRYKTIKGAVPFCDGIVSIDPNSKLSPEVIENIVDQTMKLTEHTLNNNGLTIVYDRKIKHGRIFDKKEA